VRSREEKERERERENGVWRSSRNGSGAQLARVGSGGGGESGEESKRERSGERREGGEST